MLTYMSRQAIIQKHLGTRLFKHKSLAFQALGISQDDTARILYVSADVDAAVMYPFPETPEGERLAEFRARLDDFIEGAELSVAENPCDKPFDAMFARVRPVEKEFWSIRVTDPDDTPGIRSFGAFSDTNEFVALTWEMREDISVFDEEVEAAIAAWSDYFGSEPPYRGDNLNEYLTNNIRTV
ncbi:MAG TPA: hypothetical protein VIY68_03745 [Steroidobacteraceae bacterium]